MSFKNLVSINLKTLGRCFANRGGKHNIAPRYATIAVRFSSNAPTLGYWNIRGLGEPIRLLLGYLDVDFTDTRYEIGSDKETAKNMWLKQRRSHGLAYPNLPYFIDGDTKITQANAILRYLGRKHDLLGQTEGERQKCDNSLYVATDLQQDLIKSTNTPLYEELKEALVASLDDKLTSIEAEVGQQWIAGPGITISDFRIYETLDQYRHLPAAKPVFEKYPTVNDYLRRFAELPQIQKYLRSEKFVSWPLYPPYFNCRFEPK